MPKSELIHFASPVATRAGISALAETGVMALVPGGLAADRILPLVDALLAAPALVTVVQLNGRYALDLIADLRAQAGRLMLVGADICALGLAEGMGGGLVDTAAALALGEAAGAQFWLTRAELAEQCRQRHLPHLPLCNDLAAAVACQEYPVVAGHLDPRDIARWREQLPQTEIVVFGAAVTLPNVPAFVAGGAAAVGVLLDPAQSQREIITRLRQFSAAWLAAVAERQR